jgi:GntR family transcriptional regulator / MocR family aminotransferase
VGETFPADRQFALLRSSSAFDADSPAWLPKTQFLMLMMHEALARVRTRYDAATERLLVEGSEGAHAFDIATGEGRARAESYFNELVPGPHHRWVTACGHSFSDKPDKYVSLINLATLRELEQRWGTSLDPLRFRANVYIDGAEPFAELGWVGGSISLGGAVASVRRRNGRCAATNVDPHTGARDRDIPGRLRADFGHKDLGVYLSITTGGQLAERDFVQLIEGAPPEAAASLEAPTPRETTAPVPAPPLAASRAHDRAHPASPTDASRAHDRSPPASPADAPAWICNACYYLLPASAALDPRALPSSYRCPDCGADAASVIPRADHRPIR